MQERESAASEIVGTMILLALLAGAIAILATALFSQPAPENMPAVSIVITNESRTVFLYHGGGERVPVAGLAVTIDNTLVAFSGAGNDNTWAAGETLTAVAPALPGTVTVLYDSGAGRGVLISGAPEAL